MSSGDPLVDQEAQRLEALNKMLDSLAAQDLTVLEAASPADGDDPLVDAEEEARKKRDEMLDDLAGKEKKTLVAIGPVVKAPVTETLGAQQATEPRTVEEALQAGATDLVAERRVTEADISRRAAEAAEADRHGHGHGNHHNLEATEADSPQVQTLGTNENDLPSWIHWFDRKGDKEDRKPDTAESDANLTLEAAKPPSPPRPRKLVASSPNAHATSMDLPQMFGGAFLLVAVIALVAVVRRRRKTAAPETVAMERDSGDYDYQLFL